MVWFKQYDDIIKPQEFTTLEQDEAGNEIDWRSDPEARLEYFNQGIRGDTLISCLITSKQLSISLSDLTVLVSSYQVGTNCVINVLDIKQYLIECYPGIVETDYTYFCYDQRDPEACQKRADFMATFRLDYDEARNEYDRCCATYATPGCCLNAGIR